MQATARRSEQLFSISQPSTWSSWSSNSRRSTKGSAIQDVTRNVALIIWLCSMIALWALGLHLVIFWNKTETKTLCSRNRKTRRQEQVSLWCYKGFHMTRAESLNGWKSNRSSKSKCQTVGNASKENRCVALVTESALREMILPGILPVAVPVILGLLLRAEGYLTDRANLSAPCLASLLMCYNWRHYVGSLLE